MPGKSITGERSALNSHRKYKVVVNLVIMHIFYSFKFFSIRVKVKRVKYMLAQQ